MYFEFFYIQSINVRHFEAEIRSISVTESEIKDLEKIWGTLSDSKWCKITQEKFISIVSPPLFETLAKGYLVVFFINFCLFYGLTCALASIYSFLLPRFIYNPVFYLVFRFWSDTKVKNFMNFIFRLIQRLRRERWRENWFSRICVRPVGVVSWAKGREAKMLYISHLIFFM